MKIVYQTDAAGVYVGEVVADESPLEPGVFLIPAGCVETAPPKCAARMAAVFDGKAWSEVPDWRGVRLYSKEDGNILHVDAVRITPPDLNATEAPPPSVDHVWNEKAGKWQMDAKKRLARLTAAAMSMRNELLSTAAVRMAPLQDAVDVDDATEMERAAMRKWKQYRIDLNRISQQPAFPENIAWPDMPND